MLRTFKFRIYPSRQQEAKMVQILNICRSLYNTALAERKDAWEKEHKSITYSAQQNALPKRKKAELRFAGVHSQVLQDVLRRVDKAFKGFFRRVRSGEKPGYPRFKAEFRYDSFTYPQGGNGFSLENGKLKLSKIGSVRIKLHRHLPAEAVLKTCTVKREVERWYVCITAEIPDNKKPKKEIRNAVGVDVGLTSLLTLSTGENIANPRWLKKSEEKLAIAQRELSKKKNGSQNRFRQRLRVARIHRKIRDQRRDFNHKMSRMLADDYDLIVFERLNVREMIQSSFLSKFIGDAGWSQLMGFTRYKAEEAGAAVEFVDAKNTTQGCSGCGMNVPKTLKERIHRCPYCGLMMNRDLNAARNILSRSTLGTRGSACGELQKQFDEAGSPRR